MRASKRRKTSKVEEISFDFDARHEFLTGFRRRKQARAKAAKETAERKEREERISERRKLREQRREDLAQHVKDVDNAISARQKQSGEIDGSEGEDSSGEVGLGDDGGEEGWEGITDTKPQMEIQTQPLHVEDRYSDNSSNSGEDEGEGDDEENFTSVTVESVVVTKEGFKDALAGSTSPSDNEKDIASRSSSKDQGGEAHASKRRSGTNAAIEKKGALHRKKQKKKKFRYESPQERKLSRMKQREKGRKMAKLRKGDS